MVGTSIALCPVFSSSFSGVQWAVLCRKGWKNYGTMYGKKYWLVKHPAGLLCATMVHFLTVGSLYVLDVLVVPSYLGLGVRGILHIIVSNVLLILSLIAHWNAMTTDPGAVPKNARPLPELLQRRDDIPRCPRGNCFKPPRSHFDSVSKRCVVKMDHYCPWINNVVGIGNQKLFILFCFYVSCSCAYALALILLRFQRCFSSSNFGKTCGNHGAAGELCILAVAFEAVLFGLFTTCMLLQQVYAVVTNRTYIDRLQGLKSSRTSIRLNLWEVFGDVHDGGMPGRRLGRSKMDDEMPSCRHKARHLMTKYLDWINPLTTPKWGDDW